jgi:hypothetical protein
MNEHLTADPQSTAIARSTNEEPIVLTKPTTAAVLNSSLGELLGLTTLPLLRHAIQPPPAVADRASSPPQAATG